MPLPDVRHGVWLHARKVGVILQRGDHTRFVFDPKYWRDPTRPVLGLRFEDYPSRGLKSKLRLPPWFSNLLPEGRLRDWIARDRGVSLHREMELLARVGHDLPGAVRVLPDAEEPPDWVENGARPPLAETLGTESDADGKPAPLRFSLAGVGLKFSMLQRGDRLTLPAVGEPGDWIVKLPDANHKGVPRNEFAMMQLASAVGLEVPEIRLYKRTELPDLPSVAWPNDETEAFAIRRFDRDKNRALVHIEDLAQVRGFYPDQKYQGTFETVAALVYRGRDTPALQEVARRIAFFVLIGNGDAHLKNWSLIYRDSRVPTLAPAYDIVSTVPYFEGVGEAEDLGLKLRGSRMFSRVSLAAFKDLQLRLSASHADLPGVVVDVVERVLEEWPSSAALLDDTPVLRDAISSHLEAHVSALRG